MWMAELTTKTSTADSRMGSHSAVSPVIAISCDGVAMQS